MEKESLERLLEQGESVERIAKRFGKDPSTISYWMKKYGLQSPHAAKHAAKGGLDRETLESLIAAGLSHSEIAAEVGRSKGTVRHWLMQYELTTGGSKSAARSNVRRAARAAGSLTIEMNCSHHGETDFILEGRGYYRCKRCRAGGVVRHRQKVKQILVSEAGGRCVVCGYDRSIRALQFHHLDPSLKRLGLSGQGVTYGIETLRAEAQKCVLLCANCHVEVEAGITNLPLELSDIRYSSPMDPG